MRKFKTLPLADLSAEDLDRLPLHFNDPRNFPDLAPYLEDGDAPVCIVAMYQGSAWVQCSLRDHQPHKNGYICRTARGMHVLVGRICGGHRFDGDFPAHIAWFNRQLRLQKRRRQLGPMEQTIDRIIPLMNAVSEQIAGGVVLRSAINQHARRLWDRLKQSYLTDDSTLFDDVTQRDLAAEARSKNDRQVFTTTRVPVGKFAGGAIFLGFNPGEAWRISIQRLDKLRDAARRAAGQDWKSTPIERLDQLVKEASDIAEYAERVIVMHQSLEGFVATANVESISTWAARQQLPLLARRNGTLIITDEQGIEHSRRIRSDTWPLNAHEIHIGFLDLRSGAGTESDATTGQNAA